MAYERDILDELEQQRTARAPERAATAGLLVEDRSSRFRGDVVRCTAEAVTLRDRHGNRREFRLKPAGFIVDGKPVTLVRPKPTSAGAPKVTASGSVAAARPVPAQIAKASRIWVEGKHDAELVEHVWGDDLRELGIVVEPMHGVDDVAALVRGFRPGPQRRLGVLVDHLVAGSKESRLVAAVRDPNVLVTGHPFVDVWAGVWPRVLGLDAWPDVPRGVEWKTGMCAALGTDLRTFWPRLRNKVTSYVDLRPELVGAVERLIDFVGDAG